MEAKNERARDCLENTFLETRIVYLTIWAVQSLLFRRRRQHERRQDTKDRRPRNSFQLPLCGPLDAFVFHYIARRTMLIALFAMCEDVVDDKMSLARRKRLMACRIVKVQAPHSGQPQCTDRGYRNLSALYFRLRDTPVLTPLYT